jgi:Spy/CpxP family protein refolding chaperone
MKKTTIVITSIIGIGLLLAQPGKPRGPGGQYSERMEMMMIWKLTDHLELTQDQAEKFFPSMRAHQKQVLKIRKEEKELFTPVYKKVKKGEDISKAEANKLLNKVATYEQKRSKARIDFVKDSGDILNPTQQVKLLMFDGQMKQQVRDRMQDRYKPPPPRGGKQKRRREF